MNRRTVSELLNESSPQEQQPDLISLKLKPHQLASLYKMKKIDNCKFTNENHKIDTNIGILGDLPGSGKTLTMLALIASTKDYDLDYLDNIKLHSTRNYGIIIKKKKKIEDSIYSNTTVVVVPNNLISHWESHLESYTNLIWEKITNNNMKHIVPEANDVLLVSASIYNDYMSYIFHDFIENNPGEKIPEWKRVVFDEADSINIPKTAVVFSRFIWLISSSYSLIPNRRNSGFLKELFKSNNYYNIVTEFYKYCTVETKTEFIRLSFTLEEPVFETIYCELPETLQMIKGYVNDSVISKINANDIDGAILDLGGTIDTGNNLIDLITKNMKNEIISLESKLDTLEKVEISQQEYENKKKDLSYRLNSLVERRDRLIESIKQVSKNNCFICLEILESATMVDCCKNMFCAECLLEWMKDSKTCPLCRKNIEASKLVTLGQKTKKPDVKKTKSDMVVEIIQKNPGRYIVFSDYNLKSIQKELYENNISSDILSNSSPVKTMRILQKFREKKINCILLNSKNNGAGLDIPQADNIILVHRLNEQIEMQTIGRAHRPGRIGRLKVWKLSYPREYD